MPNAFPDALQGLLRGFERAEEHLVITDRDGIIVYANKAAEKHTGYGIEEMIGRKPGQLWGGHMPPDFYHDMWETIHDHRQAFTGDMWNRHKNGTMYWQEVYLIPILNENDEPVYYIGIELAVNDPARRETLLTECVSSVNADEHFRIQWPLAWLFEADRLSDDQSKQLRTYYADEAAIDMLVSGLMVVSNLPYANQENDEKFCLYEMLQATEAEVRTQYGDRRFALEYPEPSGKCPVVSNKRLTHEVLYRLILNAAQYTAPGTGQVSVSLLRMPTYCLIRFQDNGIGISPEDQRHMFDKFHRGTKARNLHPQGSGLGLFIVKSISDLRGWTINCVSGAGTGACFELKIPLKEEAGN